MTIKIWFSNAYAVDIQFFNGAAWISYMDVSLVRRIYERPLLSSAYGFTTARRGRWKVVLSNSFRNIAPSSNRFESARTCRMHNWAIMRYSIRSLRLQACFGATKRREKISGKKFSHAQLQNSKQFYFQCFIFRRGGVLPMRARTRNIVGFF